MNNKSSRYDGRGVSADKHEVHEAIKGMDKGLFKDAFCKILPDFSGKNQEYCNIIHADTAGTKPSLAYLYWKETGDIDVWRSIAQDALVMNFDDMACVGCVTDFVLSSTIGRNKHNISGDVIKALIQGTQEFVDVMSEYDVAIHHGGGETADVGDIVRTVDVGFTIFARMLKSNLIVNNIKPGQVIIGFGGYGQATYESEYNSGIGSNGLTSARHDVLSKYYAVTYPESFDSAIPEELAYCGSKRLTDVVTYDSIDYEVGKLLLSPTRTFLPLLNKIVPQYRTSINGIIHNTGGAHTKVLNYCDNVRIVKDNLLPVPPVFRLIQEESKTSDKEMYEVFNMGTRLECYVDNDPATIEGMLAQAKQLNIPAQVIGHTEESQSKEVVIHLKEEKLHYTK